MRNNARDDRVRCPKCGGSGDMYLYDVMSRGSRTNCDLCRGAGRVSQKEADSYSPPYPGKNLELE